MKTLQVKIEEKKCEKLKQILKLRGQTITGWLRVLVDELINKDEQK